MSNYLRLTREGLIRYGWDSESRSHQPEPISQSDVLSVLRMSCRIDPDVTLADIFATVDSFPELMRFMGEYSWCQTIADFHLQARLPRPPGDDPDKLTHLEISRHVQLTTDDDNPDGAKDIRIGTDFSGIGKPDDDSGEIHYGVSLTPMNEIAHLPVRLNCACEIHHALVGTLLDRMGTYETWFTLLEVLDAIYDDISFYGGPAEAAEMKRELQFTVDDIASGRITTVPLDLGTKKTVQ